MATVTIERVLLTRREVARMLALSERTVSALTATGELPSLKIGASVRYRRADIDEYLDRKVRRRDDSNSR